MFVLATFALIATVALAKPLMPTRAFEGEQVLKCNVETREKFEFISKLESEVALDVFKQYPNGLMDIRVNAEQREMIQNAGIACNVLIEDLASLIEEAAERRRHYKGTMDVYFEEYHTYAEQVEYYQSLCQSYSNICTRTTVGSSTLGNVQYEYTLSNDINNTNTRVIFLDAGIHAREWISSATLQYVFTRLLETASENNALLSRYTWIIHGHQNPDGYIYSWSSNANRLWRKSRNTNPGSSCIGTDLNRNWPTSSWGGAGSSSNPCSDTFHGADAGSEIEVKNLQTRFTNVMNSRVVPVAISFHSYSQLILRPWGDTRADAPDEAGMSACGNDMRLAIQATHGLSYDNIKSIDLYATTGTTGDWYYESSRTINGAKTYGYTYELRDTGRYGFELPEEQIIPQGEEIWAAMLALADCF
eukprot:c15871_g1_i1.p1 GENE.c15871_g1_i1~~c15871_g1_i1.p1  ORF type:complete len:434 (+),score=14.76 c15871_g1_i1:49-1302(+)